MRNKTWIILALAMGSAVLSACVPVAIGATGAVVADKVIEEDQGGDGLF